MLPKVAKQTVTCLDPAGGGGWIGLGLVAGFYNGMER